MQYNGHTDDQDIVSMVIDATGVNETAQIKEITRASNESLRIIWSWIFEAYGGWQFDDSNHQNLPTATTDLVASQQKYTLPSEALTIIGLEVKDSSGQWRELDAITLEQILERGSENEFESTPSLPHYYRPLNGILKLYPASNYSQVASIRIAFDRGSVSFSSTDTTKTPGFASEFHGAVAAGASYIIAKNSGLDRVGVLRADWLDYEPRIKAFYSKRYKEMFPVNMKDSDPFFVCN